jgi:hypothetical protein
MARLHSGAPPHTDGRGVVVSVGDIVQVDVICNADGSHTACSSVHSVCHGRRRAAAT